MRKKNKILIEIQLPKPDEIIAVSDPGGLGIPVEIPNKEVEVEIAPVQEPKKGSRTMINPVVVKAVVWGGKDNLVYSPSCTWFPWIPGKVTVAECDKCKGEMKPECSCGLYAALHMINVADYHNFPNSVYVLLQTWGKILAYPGPEVYHGSIVTRCWGAEIIGVVKLPGYNKHQLAVMAHVCDMFEVHPLSIKVAEETIRLTWEVYQFNPYEERRFDDLTTTPLRRW